VDDEQRSGLCPKRTHIVGLYTQPPEGATVVCADELGPVVPRTFAPAPGWSVDGHRVKAPLEYSRGPEKIWVYGSIRIRDGQAVTYTASSRNSVHYQRFLELVEQVNPTGDIYVITDNLSSEVISVDSVVFVVGEYECGLGDGADFAGAGGGVVEGAPASDQEGESAFAWAAEAAEGQVVGAVVRG